MSAANRLVVLAGQASLYSDMLTQICNVLIRVQIWLRLPPSSKLMIRFDPTIDLPAYSTDCDRAMTA